MQQQKSTVRDPLVGQFVIVRGPHGAPVKAGRIRSRTPDGNYQVTIMTTPPHGEVVTEVQMAAEQWEFHIDEGNWRRAYADAVKQ